MPCFILYSKFGVYIYLLGVPYFLDKIKVKIITSKNDFKKFNSDYHLPLDKIKEVKEMFLNVLVSL